MTPAEKLCPRELTSAMLVAGNVGLQRAIAEDRPKVRAIWEACYDAAPSLATGGHTRQPRELLAEIELARQKGLELGWQQGRASALEEIETERAARAAGGQDDKCPDGGTCHHECKDERYCWRRDTGNCLPLSASGLGDDWRAAGGQESTKDAGGADRKAHAGHSSSTTPASAVDLSTEDALVTVLRWEMGQEFSEDRHDAYRSRLRQAAARIESLARENAELRQQKKKLISNANEATRIIGDRCEQLEERAEAAERDLGRAREALRELIALDAHPEIDEDDWSAQEAYTDRLNAALALARAALAAPEGKP